MGILKRLKGRERGAYFKTVIACIDAGKVTLFDGMLQGSIAEKPVGEALQSLPFEGVFIPDGKEVVMAELSPERKMSISHRSQAAKTGCIS